MKNARRKAAPVTPAAVGANANTPVAAPNQDSSDPLLAKVQDSVRANIQPQFRVAVQKIVVAGMTVMFSPQTHQLMLKQLQQNTDPAEAVGMGVTQLITLLFRESKGSMPLPACVPAAILLCCEALDFMERSGLVKVTPELVDDTTQTVVAYLMQKVGLTPMKVAQIVKQHQAQQAGLAGAPGAAPAPGVPQPAAQQGAAPAAPQPQPQPQQGLIQQSMGAPT